MRCQSLQPPTLVQWCTWQDRLPCAQVVSPCRGAEANFYGSDCSADHREFSQSQFTDKVFDVPVLLVQQVRVQCVRRQLRIHSCSSFSSLDKVVHSSLLCNDSAGWFRRQRTVQVRSCSLNVVDALFMQVLRGAAGAVPAVMDVLVIMQRRWIATAQVGRALCTGTGPGLTSAIRVNNNNKTITTTNNITVTTTK